MRITAPQRNVRATSTASLLWPMLRPNGIEQEKADIRPKLPYIPSMLVRCTSFDRKLELIASGLWFSML